MVNGLICYWMRNYEYAFFACVQFNYFVIAGVYAVYPTSVVNTFGEEVGP